mgnify:FL=1
MFDKIQSTYFKRVTTGVLALFMTASSGFSYAVPVYAQEVTTAAAKRKKEEEFSSTESSTLTLRENDKKNEAEGSKTTETDGIKVTTNGSSDVQPEVKIEKPDNKKEPGRKLSSKKAQEDLKEMIQNKKYSYQDILQRIFEIDDFTFYSKLTLDEIKFLMSGTTEEKYEIAELLMYKSVYLYADYDITTEDFYSYLFQYFQFLDECNVDLKDEEIEKIEKQLLLDINIYYVGDKDMYQKDLNEYLENTTSPYNKKIQKTCSDYVKAMKAYLFALKEDRDKNKIRLSLGLKEETKTDQEEATEQMKKTSNDFNITEGSSLKTYDHRDKDGDNLGYNSGSYFYVQLVDEGGATTTGKISVSGRSSSYGNKDSKLYGVLRDKETTWNCSLSCSPNNHNLSLNQTTVTTRKDDVKVRAKRTAGSDKGKTTTTTSYFIMNFSMGFTVHAHYNYSGRDYDIPSLGTPIRFNTDTYAAANNGTQTLDTTGTVHSDTPEAGGINVQINTGMFGVRTYNSYRYRGTKLTLTYKKPQRTLDVNGRLDGSDSGGTTGYGTFDVYLNGSCVANDVTDFYKTDIADGTSYEINDIKATNGKVYNGVYSGSASGSMCGNRSVYLKFDAPTYYLDINGELDGTWQGNLDGLGSCDVYVNGTCVGDDITDFWTQYPAGTKWEIRDIKTASGKKYRGITPGLSGTIGSSTASVVLQYTSGSTLSIDPNGGTYKGSSGVTTVNNLSPGATITVDSPTRPGYKFGGYEKSNESYQSYASNTGWTTSHGENVGTYSRSYDGSITYNEAPDGGYYRTNHVWRGIDSATDNYNCISFPTYTAQAGHTYKISGEVWISERPSGGSFALNFYHGDSSNDWKHCMWGISEGWTGKWVKFSIERTFDTTTNDARFEIWTSNLKGLTGNISFWLQGLKITDETTGNDVSMTKIAMGDSDIKLTARWIPLHSTLSYDAQGGSLGSVKSTDNPNNYKIVDNGAYFIQSGLNTSRYLHQRTNGQLNLDNATDVLTWNGYSSDSKQTLWTFERYKNTPYYYIINNFNGKAMNLSGDGPDDLSGKPIELWKQYDANNEDNSDFLWYFKDTGDGYVNIYNKMTNKALDITNGEDADGVVLQQYAPNGTASQKFKLVNYSQVYFPTREKYANNNIYINSATPVKKGCKFLGWSTSANGNVVYQPGDLYDVNQDGGNVTLYAKWEKAKYTATVKLNGGSYNGSTNDFTISKYPGEEISIGAPTRSKHNFTGYKLTMDNNDGDAPTSVTQSASGFKGIMQMGNFTLNAQWTPWKHTVRYDANAKNDTSVKGIPASQSKTANVDIKLSSDVPTRNGYTFLGWNTQADGKGTAYAAGAIYKNDQNGGTVTLYAQWTPWKHVLHYNKNVPTSSTSQTVSNMPVDQTKTFGQLMTISNLVPTRKGYTFAGWYTQSNGTGTKYDPGSNYAADQNGGTVNLYAKWTPWTYNIKYDQNVKSTSSSKTVTDMPAAQTKTQEIDVTLSSMTPKRNGYIFAGWSTSANGSVEYKPGSKFTKDLDSNGASITLYAVWTPWKHTVHYNSNIPTNAPTGTTTVSNMPGDQTKTFDEKLTISSNKPTRKGYNFAGWSTSANGNVVYQPGAEYKNDQNGGTVTLYAKWTAWKHTVTYDKNVPANSKKTDVKNMPGNQTKIYDQNLTLQSNVPTRIGYTFVKWTTNKDGTGTAYQPGSQYSYNRDSDGGTVTLYAVWTPWKYKVQYDKNVSADSSSQTVSNMPTDQTKTEEVVLTLSSNKPNRNGYIFNGWQAQINGKAVDYQPGAKLSYDVDDKDGSTIILKAQWTPWKHTVHYDKNVPANSSSQTVTNMPEDQTKTFDEKLNLSTKIPKREGYNFVGWLLEYGTAIAVVSPGTAYERDQNGGTYVLKAQWEPWKHTVHYDANGGDQSSVPNDQKKTYEQNMNVATKVPTRNEYKFLGWKAYHEYNDKSGNKHSELIGNYQPGASYNYDIDETGQYAADNGEYNKCGTVTMKAQWVQLYTVKYDGNQPAIKGVTVTGSVANQTQGQDESVNLRTNNFKNDSGVYKDWSVGKDAYKYGKLDGKIREFIHPEGFKTNHSTMQNEYTGYEGQIKLIHS